MKKISILILTLGTFGFLSGFTPCPAYAYEIENLPDVKVVSDFVVGPGKFDITMNPGEKKVEEIIITNRMGDERVFNIDIEDITGSKNGDQAVVLLGDQRGPYSLRDYLKISEKSFTLKHGQRARVPVTISIPADEESGGRYGSILVRTASKPGKETEGTGAKPGTAIESRIGVLFFVRIPGKAKEDGILRNFQIAQNKKFLLNGGFKADPINFQLVFENMGSVHLNPGGTIKLKNILGEEIGEKIVDPWYTLPDSVRLREVSWGDRKFLLGRYTATAEINRGYGGIVDTKTLTFYVLPWKVLLAGFGGIVLIFVFFGWIISKFEIKKRK